MLTDEKILVTGPAGQIALPMTEALAADNEVWGIARFADEATRDQVEALGVTTRAVDLGRGDFGDLPDDFTYLLHLAVLQGPGLDFDGAIRVNAEGTGLLMAHCRHAKAALVASTFSVYRPNPDPQHRYTETDPLGEVNAIHSPTYSMSKIAQEGVARTMSRVLDLPVTIARINASYGSNGGLPSYHFDAVMADQPVMLRGAAPTPYSLIAQDDMNAQIAPLLAAASTPATVVNWCGDEAVDAEDWIAFMGELSGRTPTIEYVDIPGTQPGAAGDHRKRLSFTGPCSVDWRDGLRATFAERY